ncbi:8-oxo-dGTP diphosphatase [Paenibacillus castaneae]|uniref:NUDIX hydrolase n=1 Tax=Paenibacillus castaneae TaxID=474957 RepID=UPI000C9CCD4B|nr:NUDIX domain-containing protein [Paenibacillus castaneae]NIK76501.1 8-oxo-dGTP diphosphatase [Paenibacillus castaneae]
MRLIYRLTDSDFLRGAPEFINTVSRFASRGVLIDNHNNVAMLYMSRMDLYKLPGGGIEKGETKEEAFLREIREETGFSAEIIGNLGYIEEHKNKNNFFQYSYCFVAKAIKKNKDINLSDDEMKSGMVVEWMAIERALEKMNDSIQSCDDYSSKFMILRDQIVLQEAVKLFFLGVK